MSAFRYRALKVSKAVGLSSHLLGSMLYEMRNVYAATETIRLKHVHLELTEIQDISFFKLYKFFKFGYAFS